jgi:hypothetical protein
MTDEEKNVNIQDCADCFGVMNRLEGKVEALNDTVRNGLMKIVYALLGLIGANTTMKYIGTPWYIEMAIYTATFSAIFVGLVTFMKRKCLSLWEKQIRIAFIANVFYVSALRIYHYQTGTQLTQLEGVAQNVLLTWLAVSFIMNAWKRDANRREKMRRWDDQNKLKRGET